MSFNYTIKEHLMVNADENRTPARDHVPAVWLMEKKLMALAGLVLIDEAKIYGMRLIADGKEYNYEPNDEITPEYKKIIAAMNNAADPDLSIYYEYTHRVDRKFVEMAGPFELMEYLKKPDEQDDSSVFYSVWNSADCDGGFGVTVAYGERNGKKYNGTVGFERVPEVPEGNWEDLFLTVYFENERFDKGALPEIKAICDEMKDLFQSVEVEADEDGISVILNYGSLRGTKDGERLIGYFKCLMEYMPAGSSVEEQFFDVSSDDARLLGISLTKGREPQILLSEL